MAVKIVQLDTYRIAIPMRSFEHAAASRDVAEGIVVRADFSDGSSGWGECLPRSYVTGETLETVVADLEEVVYPACGRQDFDSPDCLGAMGGRAGERCMNAAWGAVELAAADRLLEKSGRLADEAGEWVGLSGAIAGRVSGILGSADPAKTAKRLRLMRWFGLRDFKLKLGFGDEVDRENLRLVHRRLKAGIARGRRSLRVDVNGGWSVEETPERVAGLKAYDICVVEQPAFCGAAQLAELAPKCELPLMADESLLTGEDAALLLKRPSVWWNIRLSKNGGLSRSLGLARLAAANGIPFVVGAMVGESSILSAAQRRLLQACGPARFVEGNYGRFLLADDLCRRSVQFGYGGRLAVLRGPGLGVRVDPHKLQMYGTLVKSLRE